MRKFFKRGDVPLIWSSRPYDFLLIYLLILVLLADTVFIGIHICREYLPFISSPLFDIERDRSYAEFFQYIKLLWSIINLSVIGLLIERFYLTWSLFFCYLLVDDAFSLHENLGNLIFRKLGFAPRSMKWMSLRIQDYGEILVSLLAALVFLFVIGWAYKYGSRSFRHKSIRLIGLVAALAFFGIVVDIFHSITAGMNHWFWKNLNFLIGVVEDGGEMMMISLIFIYTFTEVSKINKYKLEVETETLDVSKNHGL
ncbi:MAG: hypothetical protein ACTS2F_25020 [Thainema sp.]